MARRTKRIALLLLAGAIVNVAVAWGCVAPHGSRAESWFAYTNPRDDDFDKYPFLGVARQFGYEIIIGFPSPDWTAHPPRRYLGSVWWPRGAAAAAAGDLPPFAVACGWPAFTLRGWRTSAIHWCILATLGNRAFMLPCQPMWLGTVANTLFYAALLWLPFCGAPAWRRARRHRRGLCVRCAYPVGEGERCSECGTPVPARKASAG